MAAPPESVQFLNNLSNAVINQPAITVNQSTNHFNADPHASLRYLYDASARYTGSGHPDAASTCLEGTRETALQDIDIWKQKQLVPGSTSEMLWLTGGAGTGKSAISQTTCERFEADGIAVVHCFLSISSRRTHPAYVFLTIAYQLAIKVPALKRSIESVIQADPSVVDDPIDKQLRRLILEPIATAAANPMPTIFVILDGLDECNGEHEQTRILCLVQAAIQGPPLPIRFLVASRPELWIRNILASPLSPPISMVTLNQDKEADDDIRIFYVSEFKKIREDPEHQDLICMTTTQWPSNHDLDTLVDRASGQFVYAKTVIRHVGEAGHQPTNRLNAILSTTSTTPLTPLGELDALYTRILSSVIDWNIAKLVLGSLAASHSDDREYLSIFEALLELMPGDAYRSLRHLHSLVYVPKDLTLIRESISIEEYRSLRKDRSQFPRFLHKSFIDFLFDSQRAGTFYINGEEAERRLALGCLKVLQNVTSASTTRLFCLTWWYAHCWWDLHCSQTGTQGNQDLLVVLDKFSLTSHCFLLWKVEKPKVWKNIAPLRLLERWDDGALKAFKHIRDVCKSLDSGEIAYFWAREMHKWIESQTDVSSVTFLKLRLKLRILSQLGDESGWI